ncbi:alcohol dehydrogenase catalytic domain-containing protein [Sodalis sp. RH21]|uniref:alcohol dehydrogenase catalytic domain-containing protein n=1 Tax=unclassified Sodalis (in: enterobacteria) TaxID=2636512 RepID=UPI0039B3E5A8
MKSVVSYDGGELRVEEVPVPAVSSPQDVLVKVVYSGLCGSDIPRVFYTGAHFYPITLGHEFSGHVVSAGSAVNDLAAGDAVACVPLLPCFECEACRRHFFSLCRQYQFVGSRSAGGNAEYIVVKRLNLLKLPAGLSLLAGAFLEPITVGLHAIHLAGGCTGKHVVIIGAGTIGLLAMQCARALGAASVSVLDINPDKLALALKTGADDAWHAGELTPAQITGRMAQRQFDQLILETAGTAQTVALALEIAGPRAQISLVGTLHRDVLLNPTIFGHILRKELRISGSWMNYSAPWPGEEWRQAVELLQDHALDIEPLIASVEGFSEYVQSVAALQGRPMQGKIMLKVPE